MQCVRRADVERASFLCADVRNAGVLLEAFGGCCIRCPSEVRIYCFDVTFQESEVETPPSLSRSVNQAERLYTKIAPDVFARSPSGAASGGPGRRAGEIKFGDFHSSYST